VEDPVSEARYVHMAPQAAPRDVDLRSQVWRTHPQPDFTIVSTWLFEKLVPFGRWKLVPS
jgi:hypothetical protein